MIPGISPCGYAVDFLRSCYSTQMRVFQDPGAPLVDVQWYFVPSNRPALPVETVFTSRNWEPYPVGWPALGEVEGAARPWRNGSLVGDAPATVF